MTSVAGSEKKPLQLPQKLFIMVQDLTFENRIKPIADTAERSRYDKGTI
jgi:hypothetical protein